MKLVAALVATLTLGLVAAGVASTKEAASYDFLGAKWPDSAMPIPYCVNATGIPADDQGQPLMSAQGFAALVQQQAAKWQALPDSYAAFRYTGLCGNDPHNGSDHVNTVGWGTLEGLAAGQVFPGVAQETPFRRGLSGDFIEVDVIIDDRLARSFDRAAYMNHVLPVIVIHELGHFLGLAHSERGCAVMAPSSLQLEFCDDDIAGLRALYPGPERASSLRVGEASCGASGVDATFRWSPSPEAEGYYLDVSLDAGFNGWANVYAGSGSSAAVRFAGIAPGRANYWRTWTFRGGLGGHTSGPAFVAPNCFGGVAVPAGPADLGVSFFCSPEGLVAGNFRWTQSLAADGYYLDLTLDPGFGGFLNALTGAPSYTWVGLLPGAIHYYRVYAFNGSGAAHSFAATFTPPRC